MRAFCTAIILGLLLLAPAQAQPSDGPVRSDEPGSSEPMIATQFRHIKLWFAAKFGNWRLAAYELDQIESDLSQAAKGFPAATTPEAIAGQVAALRNSVQAKDVAGFAKAYTELTAGCNACHRAVGRDFITVQVPAVSPFTDQVFADQVAEGRTLAHTICGTCHVVPDRANATPGMGLPAPSFADLVRRPSFTEASLRQLLASNHRRLGPDQTMPNPRLSENQIEEIVAYFEALKAGQKR